MFRKTDTNPQLDLFTTPGNILPKRAWKKYADGKAWHNQFFTKTYRKAYQYIEMYY